MMRLARFVFRNHFYPVFFLLSLAGSLYASGIKFPAATIPNELKRNAGAVIRLYETRMEITSGNKVRIHTVKAITILHEVALSKASLVLYYDKFKKVEKLKGVIYNQDGLEIDQVKLSDFTDRSAVPDGTFHSDDRCLIYHPVYNGRFPVTFEFEYDVVWDMPVIYPTWSPQYSYNLSVENASLTITAPPGEFPRYRELSFNGVKEIQPVQDPVTITWIITHLPAVIEEPYSLDLSAHTPKLLLAPVQAEYASYSDAFSTWDDVGKWHRYLWNERDQLSSRTQALVKRLVSGMMDTLSMVKAVFRYVQSRTRYVSVQVGIGGWQPLEAGFVDEKGYGDCKALVNYTSALLKVAGIRSCFAPVISGKWEQDIVLDFPSVQFNHVILCVPLEGDSIWLECTNPNLPFGFLGSFTDNRHTLVVAPDRTLLVKTPEYSASVNRRVRNAIILVSASGDATIEMETRYQGVFIELVADLAREGAEEQKKQLATSLGIPDLTIQSISYSCDSNRIPLIREKLVLFVRSFASTAGERLFAPVNLFNRMGPVPVNQEERQSAVFTGYPFSDFDTIQVVWPANYQVESIPSEKDMSADFGTYTSSVLMEPERWIYIRTFIREKVRFPKEDYPEFRSFTNRLAKADREKVILLRKTP